LTIQIQQQKEYQQGLEEKILTDHEKLEAMEKKYNELLTTVSKKESGTPTRGKSGEVRADENQHKKCEEEKKRLEEIIQELEESLSKVLENSPPRRREDEDYLVLQEKLNEKESYIGELELLVKNMQNEIYKLEEEIAELYAEKEEREQ
jgi:DNA repair exonuclease SbcCD ATPase subunit